MAKDSVEESRILASLPLQILLFFNKWYIPLYWAATLALLIYKAVDLPYPNPSKGMEFFALFAFVALESIAAAFGYVYYMIWQTYVTYLDIPLNAIGLFFVGSELLFALHQIWKLSRTNAY